MKTKSLQILFTKEELDNLEKIRKKLGVRHLSEVIRYLIQQKLNKINRRKES